MNRISKLSAFRVLLGLMVVCGASAAHATQCTPGDGSLLNQSLVQPFGSPTGEGGCNVDPSHHEDEGGDHGHEGGDNGWPPITPPPHDGWFGGHYYKDGKDCTPPVVPLPPTSLLLASGVIGLLALGRRRRLATA